MKREMTKTLIVSILVIIVLCISFFAFYKKEYETIKKKEDNLIVNNINKHYNKYVKTIKNTKLYKKKNNKYVDVIDVSKDVEFTLKDIKIDKDTKYFEIEGFDCFIKYEDVAKIDNITSKDTRYKKYIVFNENVKSKNRVNLYKGDKVIYKLNYSIDLPIVEKGDNGVYIDFYNDLYFIKNEDISNTYEKINSSVEVAEEVPVTVYHFIYLHGEECGESICHSEDQIKSHFEYLSNNDYFTITTNELKLWNENKIRLPKKSILVTIDDGARAEKFIPFLEQYKIHATLFLVTSWYSIDTFKSDYLEIASHTDNLHTPGVCSGGQGSPLKCLPINELVDDLKKSREKTGTSAFCFPFYEFNDHAIEAVKQAGFSMSFIGGQRKMKKGDNLYTIPRISLHSDDSLDYYINVIS